MTSVQGHFESQLAEFWKDDFAPLKEAGQAVLAALREEEAAPDADLYRQIATSSPGSHAYFDDDQGVALKWNHVQSDPLPELLSQQLATAQSHSLMGLLTPASLAWLSVDHKLYLWSLRSAESSGESLMCFEVPSKQCVVSVGLVKPKKDVFLDDVKWIVVVTTPQEIYLCALVANSLLDDGNASVRLVPTSFTLPTDGVRMLSISGTLSGRIFLGGDDGCVYEVSYEGRIPRQKQKEIEGSDLGKVLDRFYEEDIELPDVITIDHESCVTSDELKPFTMGKRAWSAMSGGGESSTYQQRKCRKLNRSVDSVLRAVLPDAMVRVAASIFGGKNATGGGGITQMVVDEERETLYTLGSKGWICSFDLRTSASDENVRLASIMDTIKTTRCYLEAVGRGRVAPPGSSYDAMVASIVFPGGSHACQAGVGGMDGARSILKMMNTPSRVSKEASESVLKPVTLQLVPSSESSRITLVAVTQGGIRLYLSSLSPTIINHGPASSLRGVGRSKTMSSILAPHNKFTLCHMRIPPMIDFKKLPQDATSTVEGAIMPRFTSVLKTSASWYKNGSFIIAVQKNSSSDHRNGSLGEGEAKDNVIITACKDSANHPVAQSPSVAVDSVRESANKEEPEPRSPGGISETIALPMATARGVTDINATLPGGLVCEIASIPERNPSVKSLSINSATPTDSELNLGLPSAFRPPSRATQPSSSKESNEFANLSTSFITDSSSSTDLVETKLPNSSTSVVGNILAEWLPRTGNSVLALVKSPGGTSTSSYESQKSYRISLRGGAKGFSSRAEEMSSGRIQNIQSSAKQPPKSARLRQWLLRPAPVPLSSFSTDHFVNRSREVVAINAGGLHYFVLEGRLKRFADAIVGAGERGKEDASVTKFFTCFGYKEACAMCLTLALGCGPASGASTQKADLRRWAMDAAFARAKTPQLVSNSQETNDRDGSSRTVFTTDERRDRIVPRGFEFKPSALSEAVFAMFTRLIRPIWHKPAVVVSEGPAVKSKWSTTSTIYPAKVELLLDDSSLAEISQPLRNLRVIMKTRLYKAVESVPGISYQSTNRMDVDSGSGGLDVTDQYLTRALQYHGQSRTYESGAVSELPTYEAETISRLIEEKNIHSLFRLLSRVIQLLDLFPLLSLAQHSEEFREVDWGLLHGLTFSQLAGTLDGQDRLEKLLNALVTNSVYDTMNLTTQADHLVDMLGERCYLFFSPGSRYAYIGMRKAASAMKKLLDSAARRDLVRDVCHNFMLAAQHWRNASLITGRMLHKKEKGNYKDLALRAMQYDSPLAIAVDTLIKLDDVENAVNICLVVASNFKKPVSSSVSRSVSANGAGDQGNHKLEWEYSLYHKRQDFPETDSSIRSSVAASPSGADVTSQDAVDTCYALVFYHLSALLKSPSTHFASLMLECCSGSSDKDFTEAFYLHMVESGNVDTLLRIRSPELEEWLRNREDRELLWRYYNIQGRGMEAGQVLWMRGSDASSRRSLNERIDDLSKALNAMHSAMKDAHVGSHLNIGELSHKAKEVDESLQVARIQSRILREIESMGPALPSEITEEMLDSLKTTLVNVSELYNNYAVALDLYEFCLQIRHVCRHNDPEATRIIWKHIISKEMLPCVTRSDHSASFLKGWVTEIGRADEIVTITDSARHFDSSLPIFENGDWVRNVEDKVVSLGQQLYGKGFDPVFPPNLLLVYLEELYHAVPGILRPDWPLLILARVGVPYLVILDTYEGILLRENNNFNSDQNESRWKNQISAMIELLSHWVRAAAVDNSARQELTGAFTSGRLLPKIDSIRGKLETYRNTSALQEDLRSIQAFIQDLL